MNGHLLCLCIDGLRPDVLGAYGNAQKHTPNFNRLSATSCLFDLAFHESPTLEAFYQSAWCGIHPAKLLMQDDSHPKKEALGHGNSDAVSFLNSVSKYQTCLITNDLALLKLESAKNFDRTIQIPVMDKNEFNAERLFATWRKVAEKGATFLEEQHRKGQPQDSPWLVWIHVGGLVEATQAYISDIAEQLAEQSLEEEPQESDASFQYTEEKSPAEMDTECDEDSLPLLPDEYYAMLASDMDDAMQPLLAVCDQAWFQESSTLLFAASRGVSLEEFRFRPTGIGSLFEETIHMPLWIRLPIFHEVMMHCNTLVTARDIHATITHLCCTQTPIDTSDTTVAVSLISFCSAGFSIDRGAIVLVNDLGELGIRTHDWYMKTIPSDKLMDSASIKQFVSQSGANESTSQILIHEALYSKPDDRWELNEVSSLREDVVEELQSLRNRLLLS